MKTQVIGAATQVTEDQAQRVKDFMNYQITEIMEEYDPDTDQMLFYLPLTGSTSEGLLRRRQAAGCFEVCPGGGSLFRTRR